MFFGGKILAGNCARPAVPGNHASKNWNGLSKMSELFTVDASSLALTSMDSSLPSVVLITKDPLSSCPPKKLHLRGQNKANSFFDKPLYASELSVLHYTKQPAYTYMYNCMDTPQGNYDMVR